ncbi:ABC transporter substrate-binding protein [Paraburkholderia sp. BL10I2N1]|uniref:ABC transporter substrate-binding protein n=1 Tax=Paraburkholderia sp. BL10I2N1 TaxID=1938796 RepID=UPI0014150D2C|nr:ABC transporter substrate-binding protein [Paraburkholderia sp. BL10I2N1]
MRALLILAPLLLGAGSGLAQQQGPGVTDKEIKIGAWMPLTGPVAAYGVPQRAGFEAYLSMINDRGGIKGRKFNLIVEDNGFNAQRTVAAARKLTSRDGVLAIVCPNGTANTAATFSYLLDEAKVPIINPYGGAEDWYNPARANLFGAQVLYEAQAQAIGRWAAKDGHRKMIVVYSSVAAFENVANKIGPSVKAIRPDATVDLYPTKLNTQDYGPIALEIAQKKPDALLLILTQPEIVALAKELQQQGFHPALYSYAPTVSNALIELAGPAVEGMKSVSWTVPPTLDTPAVREYREALAKYAPTEKPDYLSLFGFGMAKIFVEAVRRIEGPITRESLVKAMYSIRNYDSGIFPPVSYGPNQHLGVTALQRVQISASKWQAVGEPIDSAKAW